MSAIYLDTRDDGSVSLYIDGDLQFDSRDEQAYHECLALPALAMAERRHPGPLRALICGGGDGLIARELLKSPRMFRIDLVDCDADVLALARSELRPWNGGSVESDRLTVHTGDAWAFVETAAGPYDLVIVDLTVPQERSATRFFSVAWYDRLRRLVASDGVLAANVASPSATPDAYWSAYHAMRHGGWQPRPYRIALRSFADHGYGEDWGFLLASPDGIQASEIEAGIRLAHPRSALTSTEQLRRLFWFPASVAERRGRSLPVGMESDVLLHYLAADQAITDPEATWDGLAFALEPVVAPPPDSGLGVLPPEVRDMLADPIGPDEQRLLDRVLALLPSLGRHQTQVMVAAFLEDPLRYLRSIDLRGLVEELLRRAARLPARLVAELRLLSRRLSEAITDRESLFRMGLRVVTVVTVVIIMANLIYPDAVYGKGGSHGSDHHDSWLRSSPTGHEVVTDTDLARGGGFRNRGWGRGQCVDEDGILYPSRRYRYRPFRSHAYGYGHFHRRPHGRHAPAPASDAGFEGESLYRLSPDTDMMPDGRLAMELTEQAYLLADPEAMLVVDRQSGEPLMTLERQPVLLWKLAKELQRQRLGLQQTVRAKEHWLAWVGWLDFVPWYRPDQEELANLKAMVPRFDTAIANLGFLPDTPPPLPPAPRGGQFEVFSSVWMLADARGVVLARPGGEVSYLYRSAFYTDSPAGGRIEEPFPGGFRQVVVAQLTKMVKERQAVAQNLQRDLVAMQAEIAALNQDAREYDRLGMTGTRADDRVDYGATEITLAEAKRRTNRDLMRSLEEQTLLNLRAASWPAEVDLAERVLRSFQGWGLGS